MHVLFLELEIVFQDIHLVEFHISENWNYSWVWTITTLFAAMWNHRYPCDFGEDLSRLCIMSFWTRHFFHFRDGDLKWISSLSMTTAAAFIDRFCLLWHRDYDGIKSPEGKAFLGEGKHKKQTKEWGIEVEPKKTLWIVLEKWYLQQDIENDSSRLAWEEMVVTGIQSKLFACSLC